MEAFFALMGSVHAVIEGTQIVPNTPQDTADLRHEVRELEGELNVLACLRSYAVAAQNITGGAQRADGWYLLELQPEKSAINVSSFPRAQFDVAKNYASQLEEKIQGSRSQVVLVSAESLKELKKAYPNYFADTHAFAESIENFLKKSFHSAGLTQKNLP